MKKRTIFDLIFIFLLLLLLIFLGTRDYSSKMKEDNKKFDQEYSLVSEENVFSYIKEEDVYENLQKESGIFFMGFSKNEWSNYYAKIINDAAKEEGITKIYYYDFLTDRTKDSFTYKKIVSFLKKYLKKDDQNKVNLYAPCLVIVKEGNVLFYDDETSFVTGNVLPESYWTEEKVQMKKMQFQEAFKMYLGGNVDGGEN